MTRASSFIRGLVAEPTVHFALVAALIFAVAAASKSRAREVIEIDRAAIDTRIAQIERGRGTPLTAAERQLAATAFVDEHVLAHVARASGLDQDERIRGILYQRMLQVLSGTDVQPGDDELRAYYARNRSRYTRMDGARREQLPFDAVRDLVRFDWLTEHEESVLKTRIAALRERFAVRIVADEAVR
jgi:hypothetical protein